MNTGQLFDAVIIVTSFTLDLIFVEGITGVQGEETLAFIIIFLLWRVLRVINGKYRVYITTFGPGNGSPFITNVVLRVVLLLVWDSIDTRDVATGVHG